MQTAWPRLGSSLEVTWLALGGPFLKGANSIAASGLVLRSDLVGTGRAISILFGINGVRNNQSHLAGPPFPEFKASFSATTG